MGPSLFPACGLAQAEFRALLGALRDAVLLSMGLRSRLHSLRTLDDCANCLSVAVTKHTKQKKLKEGRVHFGSGPRAWSIVAGCPGSWSHCIHSQEARGKDAGDQLVFSRFS